LPLPTRKGEAIKESCIALATRSESLAPLSSKEIPFLSLARPTAKLKAKKGMAMDSIADIPNILAHSSLAMLAFVIRDLLIHNFCVPLFITINYKLEQEFLSVQYLSLLVSDFLL
jgi:hypothetical protein